MDAADGTQGGSGLPRIRTAEVVLPCDDLDGTLRFFTERLGLRLEAVFPADDPAVAVVSGFGVRLRLQRGATGPAGVLRLLCDDPSVLAAGALELTAPNGTRIELASAEPRLALPPLRASFVLSRLRADAVWQAGRAGMHYRDLVPDRQGGRFIASHVRIPDGGPVPDYVHFHRVRFQMIYCYAGWVRVVYEDQGPPFVMHAGDCVLQPPEIRHRVLESSPGLEVVEIASPADHETFADRDLELPTEGVRRERDFGGQRFVRHEAATAEWRPWRLAGFEARDLGIAAATDGFAGARVVRATSAARPHQPEACRHDAELLFVFVLKGSVALRSEASRASALASGDSFVIPAAMGHALSDASEDLELLEVTLPADFATTPHGGELPPAG